MLKNLLSWAGKWALRAAGQTGPLTDTEFAAMLSSGNGSSASGQTVSESLAYGYSAFYSGVCLLSETIGSLPAHVYKRTTDDERERDSSHDLSYLLRRRANPEMSAMTAFETVQANCFCWGHGYAEIERSEDGRPIAIWPIHSSYVRHTWDNSDQFFYELNIPGESKPEYLRQRNMLHISAPLGYGLIDVAKENIGLGTGTRTYGGKFFGNGTTLGTVFERDASSKMMNDKHINDFLAKVAEGNEGLSKAHRKLLLPIGVKAHVLGMSPEVAQFLETRRFEIEEIARFLRMPVYLLRETSHGVSYASLEIQSQEMLVYTLRPWLVRWADELSYKLLSAAEQATHYIEHNTNQLLMAALLTRYQAYSIGRMGGWLSRNDIRRAENMSPIDGGDDYLTPLNMGTVGSGGPAARRKAKLYARAMRSLMRDVRRSEHAETNGKASEHA